MLNKEYLSHICVLFDFRDLNSIKMCIDSSVPTCSEPTKQMFQMGYAWMDYMVRPACSAHFDLSESSCMKAGQCLEKFGQYSMRAEKLEQKDFCRYASIKLNVFLGKIGYLCLVEKIVLIWQM